MKSRQSTSWNTLVDRLVATLETSRKIQKKFIAQTNAEAMEQIKTRIMMNGKPRSPRRGRPPSQLVEIPL
jgi:hypothetical protein